MYRLVLFLVLLNAKSLVAQELINESKDSINYNVEISDYDKHRNINNLTDLPSGYERINPKLSIWGRTSWNDDQLNFRPEGRSFPAGDLNGDGSMDLYRVYNDVPDERDNNLESTTNKTLLFWDAGTVPDLIVYEELIPIGDINGDGHSNALSYEEESERWHLYHFTKNSYSREVFNLTNFNSLFDLSSNTIAHHDINKNGYEDLIFSNHDTIYILYGSQDIKDMSIEAYHASEWEDETGFPISSLLIKDLYWSDNSPYLILRTLHDSEDYKGRYALILSIKDNNEPVVKQSFKFSDEVLGNLGLLQAHKLTPNESPYLIWIYPIRYDIYIFQPSEEEGTLFKKEPIDWGNQRILPVGDITGDETTEFIIPDHSGFARIGYTHDNPERISSGPEMGGLIHEFTQASVLSEFIANGNIDYESIVRYHYGDVTGNSYNDYLLLFNDDDSFGQILVEGNSDLEPNTFEIIYKEEDYFRTIRENVYNLGDVSGNGYDDIAIDINHPDQNEVAIYEGGNGFESPLQLIKTDFNQIRDIISGSFNEKGRLDIAISGHLQEENDPPISKSKVKIYKGGEVISKDPYHVIDEREAYPEVIEANRHLIGTMTTAGDVNNTGYDDLLIGAPLFRDDEGNPLPVLLYEGGSDLNSEADHRILYYIRDPGGLYGPYWGNTIHALGDISGNGIDDFAIANPDEILDTVWDQAGHTGAVHIFYGQDSEDNDTSFEEPNLTLKPNMQNAQNRIQQFVFGFSEIAIGDFNGSGYKDLAVKSFRHHELGNIDNGYPGIHIFNGGPNMSEQPDHMVGLLNEIMSTSDQNGKYTSASGHDLLHAIPDVNDSGHDELLVIGGSNSTNGVLLQGSDNSIQEAPVSVFFAPNQSISMGADGSYTSRHYKSAVGNFSNSKHPDFMVTQQEDLNYRDTPVYKFSIDEASFTHITDDKTGIKIEGFELSQNYPNPFNPSTQIHYELPERAQVRLEVYDILGRRVSTLVDEQQQAGRYEVTFDASGLASGTYIYRIEANEFIETSQMMFVK